METMLQGKTRARGYKPHATLARGMGWGVIGGLAGTVVMDLLLMGALSALGMPTLACFSIVGDTGASLFSILGVEMAGGIPLGVATHYLIGPIVGAIFGAVVAQFHALRAGTLKKCVILAVLYVEVLSQPLLALTPPLLKMTPAEALEWFGGSFVMHFMWGIVLGVVVSHGLKLGIAANHNDLEQKL